MKATRMADLQLGVTQYPVIGIKAGGEPHRSTIPAGPLHASTLGSAQAACGAPVVDILDEPWPPSVGACHDCRAALVLNTLTTS